MSFQWLDHLPPRTKRLELLWKADRLGDGAAEVIGAVGAAIALVSEPHSGALGRWLVPSTGTSDRHYPPFKAAQPDRPDNGGLPPFLDVCFAREGGI